MTSKELREKFLPARIGYAEGVAGGGFLLWNPQN